MSGSIEENLNRIIDNVEIDIELDNIIYSPENYYPLVEKYGVSDKIKKLIEDFKPYDSDGTALYEKHDYSIGIICDEFMYYSLENAANFKYISLTENINIDDSLDLVLVVTAWKGLDNSWQYLSNPEGKKRASLLKLLKDYNNSGIPTVFYSKEDPVNYDKFLSIANECKYIFTSAKEIINDYKRDTGNKNVGFLEFGVNPLYHNPIGKHLGNTNNKEVIFAGSWMEKYPERNREASMMFDGVMKSKFNLNIVDRNYDRKLKSYQFPPKYLKYVSKTLLHQSLMNLHKATTYGLNLNSVKYSNTMFANRVYELQAMGNIVLSNYSMGVNNIFPNISIVNDINDVKQILHTNNHKKEKEMIAKNIFTVMLNHTSYHRVSKILNFIGLKSNINPHKILVVGQSEKTENSFDRQDIDNSKFVLEKDLNESLIDESDFVTYFSDSVEYEEFYLKTLLSGFAYTNSEVIEMTDDTYTYKKEKFYDKYLAMVTADYMKETHESPCIFTIPKIEIYEAVNKEKDEKLLSVIIPIHNNGKFLEDKCIRSLERSSIFHNMQLILIDDGTDDIHTLKIIERIRRRLPSVQYYRFEEGSGSASRPRNKGIEMVKTKYMTFLDPDNEAIGDGYSTLLKTLLDDESIDMSLGNVIKEDHLKKTILRYTYYIKKYNGTLRVNDTKKFLINAGLRAHSIQALIIKSSIVQQNKLKMVEGAAGQDTMFFQELLLYSKSLLGVEETIHTYYAAVDGSVTNTIRKNFFEKYYKLEIERIPFLKKHGLYDIYIKERLPFYFKNWYISRFERVQDEDKKASRELLLEIFNMYREDYDFTNNKFNKDLKEFFGTDSTIVINEDD